MLVLNIAIASLSLRSLFDLSKTLHNVGFDHFPTFHSRLLLTVFSVELHHIVGKLNAHMKTNFINDIDESMRI